jgi:3-hydroxyisobutyrate dehydrogenase-like beta-hydroxyacid dehydrogenase
MSETVGVIGLGRMGGAMAANLVKHGFRVVGFDVSATACASAAAAGTEIVQSSSAVFAQVGLLILSLPSAGVFDAVSRDIAAVGPKQAVVIDTSTLPLETKRNALAELGRNGGILLDAPVNGGKGRLRSPISLRCNSGQRGHLAHVSGSGSADDSRPV